MSLAMQVDLVRDTASPAVDALLRSVRQPKPVLEVMGQAGVRTLRDWFRARPSNNRGWRSSGFWTAQSRGTAVSSVSDQEAVVAVTDPDHPGALGLRVRGGEITPKRGRYLALPAMAAAYAAGSPREGGAPGALAFVYAQVPAGGRWPGDAGAASGDWRKALAMKESVWKEVGKPRKDGTRRRKLVAKVGEVWYWLVSRVRVYRDPDAVPPESLLQDACTSAALSFLATEAGRRTQQEVAS